MVQVVMEETGSDPLIPGNQQSRSCLVSVNLILNDQVRSSTPAVAESGVVAEPIQNVLAT